MTVVDRFLQYVTFGTQSDEGSSTCPSTQGQRVFGAELVRQLTELGAHNARQDEYGYVYGWLPATAGMEGVPCLGFIAHMDTASAAPGDGVKPRRVVYQGGELVLNEALGVSLDPERFPQLAGLVGKELIVTDGTTLLGADDKAGASEIMAAAAYLVAHPEIPHGRIAIGFTPDEELGRGPDHFDVEGFGATAAYTVDGGVLGNVTYENFSAAKAHVTIHGVNIHPGTAKGKMKNALLMACELVGMMPPKETPAHTDGYEGFFHLYEVTGDEERATLSFLVRDFEKEGFQRRKDLLRALCAQMDEKYGPGTAEVDFQDQYYNMREPLEDHMYLIHRARAAFEKVGVPPSAEPSRGGTDGARLTFMGLPCPNLSHGGINSHSVYEFIPVSSLETMTQVLIHLMSAE